MAKQGAMNEPLDIEVERAACRAATEGPWLYLVGHETFRDGVLMDDTGRLFGRCDNDGNGQFIARVRAAYPQALDELEAARADTERLRAEVAELIEECFLEQASRCTGPKEGWYSTDARTSTKINGDQLVELGLYERHPDGAGRMWRYRPVKKQESSE